MKTIAPLLCALAPLRATYLHQATKKRDFYVLPLELNGLKYASR